jgi:hypothetical protein
MISHIAHMLFNFIMFYHIFNNILIPTNVHILMPYSISMTYILFVLDHTERTLLMFDIGLIQNGCQDIPYKRFVKKILNINVNYAQAARHECERWFQDIFLWKHVPIEDTLGVDR